MSQISYLSCDPNIPDVDWMAEKHREVLLDFLREIDEEPYVFVLDWDRERTEK